MNCITAPLPTGEYGDLASDSKLQCESQAMAQQLRPGDGDSREATPARRQVVRTNFDGVSLVPRKTLSFSVATCRENHPLQCPGECCSHCTNPGCVWPRGKLYWRRGKYEVLFQLVDGHILCTDCAAFQKKRGIPRSEAAQSALLSAKWQGCRARLTEILARRASPRPLRPSSRADPDWKLSANIGESALCELHALLSSVCVTG